MSEIIFARTLQRYDTLANWNAADPLLLRGEFAIVDDNGNLRTKIGDGATNFSSLPFTDDISNAFFISTAVPATNPGAPIGNRIYETATAGTYTHFLDNTSTAIVVNAGEYARLIDNGTFFTKVLVPLSLTGYATLTDVSDAQDEVFNLAYQEKPGKASVAINSKAAHTYTTNGNTSEWYVDPRLAFDNRRARFGYILAPGAGNVQFALITIEADDTMTIVATVAHSVSGAGVSSTDLFNDFPFEAPGVYFIGVRTTSGNLVRTAAAGGQPVYRTGATGGAYTILSNTDVNYWVEVWEEDNLQIAVNRDTSVQSIVNVIDSPYRVGNAESIIIADPAGGANVLILPKYGIPAGKVYIIRNINPGVGVIVVNVEGSGLIDYTSPPLNVGADPVRLVWNSAGDTYVIV